MNIFPIKLMSQWDKANNLLKIINKYKNIYVKPDIVYGKNIDDLVSRTIKNSIQIETIEGKTKINTNNSRIAHAISLKIIYNSLIRNIKSGK